MTPKPILESKAAFKQTRFAEFFFEEITQVPDFFKREHYPSLNGFRAISVILVIFFHLNLSNNNIYKIIFNGSLGVNVFFVLSGFLITSLLLKEKAKTGTISLRYFYLRRIFRILPAAYLCIATVAVLNYFFHFNISYIYLVAAALFVVNFEYFSPIKTPFISHYWSLSVEEQFYFLFPFLVKKNITLFIIFLLFIIIALPLIFSLQYIYPVLNHGLLFAIAHYFIKFQGISVGCLSSILCFKNIIHGTQFKYKVALKIIITIAIFSIVQTGAINEISVYTNLLISILISWLLVLNLFSSNDFFYKFLNLKLVSKIGMLSYSIYIWHLLILNLTIQPKVMWSVPLSILITFIVAWVSYNYLEKPFLKLKIRFSIVKDKP